MNFPKAEKKTHTFSHLNQQLSDPYHWLRDLESNPEVRKLVDSENQYFRSKFPKETSLEDSLFEELKNRQLESDTDVPEKLDNYFYYSRTEKNKEYEIHCRKKDTLDSPEEIYFDENSYAKSEYFDLGCLEMDSSHQKAIYSIDDNGDEVYRLYSIDFITKEEKALGIDKCSGDVEWVNNSEFFYYVKLDEALRPYQIYRSCLSGKTNELVYEEKDPEYFLSLSSSKDEKYIFIESHGSVSSEIYYLDANQEKAEAVLYKERQKATEYYLGHRDGYFYVLSNKEKTNFALYQTKVGENNERLVFSSTDSLYLSDFEVFKDFIILFTKEHAKEQLLVLKIDEKGQSSTEKIPMPDDCYHISSADNSNFDVSYFHFIYSSMASAPKYFRYHIANKNWECLKEFEVPGDYVEPDYHCKQVFLPSRDGKQIPVSYLFHKDYPPEKAKGAYLYVYGAYGAGMDCGFSRNIISLVKRGFVYVILHVRGGNELGRNWYEDGKYLNKKNTFYDIIDCSEEIISRFPTLKDRLILSGGSAGGLSVGATINLRPDLYKIALLNVPFVDMMNTMLDDSQALTQLEYEEWGNPNKEDYFKYMLSYSPYNNIQKEKTYPVCLAIASLFDQRVRYWEALKWIQKLRDNCTNPDSQYLFTNTDAGHAGSSGRYEYLKELAMEFRFIIEQWEN